MRLNVQFFGGALFSLGRESVRITEVLVYTIQNETIKKLANRNHKQKTLVFV
jgi:hypothetical protein